MVDTGWPFYLEGVVLARSSPRVLMTRLPHTHSPMMIPTPPYTRIQMGVWVFWAALPSEPIIHRATRGPIELLKTKQMIHGCLVKMHTLIQYNHSYKTVKFNFKIIIQCISFRELCTQSNISMKLLMALYNQRKSCLLPDVVSSMSKRSEHGG